MEQFKEIPLLESLLNFQKNACNNFHIGYLQNVTTLRCKMANNVRAHLASFANHGVKHSDKYVHRIVNCREQLTNKIHIHLFGNSGNLVSFPTVKFL